MNLEMAQHIIEQEALPLLLANPNFNFDINSGSSISLLFYKNKSQVVNEYTSNISSDPSGMNYNYKDDYFYHVFKIDHPEHDISYYSIKYINNGKGHMVELVSNGDFKEIT